MELSEIHKLEIMEKYPDVIDALEERLQTHSHEAETIIRLGFNLWYAVVENLRMGMDLPTEDYSERFMVLFKQYKTKLHDESDFCWAFGLGISLFAYMFPGANEQMGDKLLERAKTLDSFYSSFYSPEGEKEIKKRFSGRGIFANYYNVVEQIAP